MSGGYLLHHLLDSNRADPGSTALIEGMVKHDYAAFVAGVDRIEGALRSIGLRRGDRVGVLLGKGVAECHAVFGVSRADCVLVPINPLLRPGQVRHILADCGARVLITASGLLNTVATEFETLDSLEVALVVDGAPAMGTVAFDVVGLDAAASRGVLATARSIGEDLAAILYTSGSTGPPKGVMLSHRNLVAGTRIVRDYLGIGSTDRILSILPLSFDYGLNQLLTAVERGASLVPFSFQLGDQVVSAIREHEITGLAGVPPLWAILTRAPGLRVSPPSTLRYITNSGGAVPVETVRRLRELLPDTAIYLMYGLTEAFRSTYLPPEEIDRRPSSIGRAIPETEVFLVDENDAPVPPNTPGILVHRGPTVSLGYWNRPEDTARVLRPNPLQPATQGGDTVCYSGDLVTCDEDGFFYFVGRRDAMIKSAGYRISPTEVEEVLMETHLFSQVAVIGLPDPVMGQRIHAVAVAAYDRVSVGDALAHCARALPAHMTPKSVELVASLPVGPNGKADYKKLVEERTRDGG